MITVCFKNELTKLRRAPIWIAFALLPALSALIGCANYLMNLDVLEGGWPGLWTQQTIFVCYFFLPALLGAGCSYLWRQEHINGNWNGLMAQPVGALAVVLGKFLAAVVLSAVAFIAVTTFYFVSGIVIGVPGNPPLDSLALYIGLGFLGSLVIVAAQSLISMTIRNFAAPVGIALVLGVVGLIASSAGAGYVFPYSLMQTAMNSNSLITLTLPHIILVATLSLIYSAACIAAAAILLKRRDVIAYV